MATLRPFAGVRYSSEAELGQLACPPYDVISPAEQQELYDRHRHNAIRLELARPEGDDRYGHVGRLFESWLADGVLRRDDAEGFYVYRQDFTSDDGTRHRVAGVMGALQLEEFGDSSGVLPHERTMAGPKEDRLALMRACPVNISPIYAIYRRGGETAPYLDALENRPTRVRFQDEHGVLHRLWVVTAPAETRMLSEAIDKGPLVIADGHHRYETALAFHRERLDSGEPGDHGSILCYCVDADAEDLVVLPYNRAVKTATPIETVLARLDEQFDCQPVDPTDPRSLLEKSDADHPLLFVFRDQAVLARVNDSDVIAATGERHPAWRSLDVVALHETVLPALLDDEPDLVFSRDPDEVARSVRGGERDFAVLLRALHASQVVDVASSGERMPQKASYFWPKAVTGLVFHSLS